MIVVLHDRHRMPAGMETVLILDAAGLTADAKPAAVQPNTTMFCRLRAMGWPSGPHNITDWLV